MRKTDKEGFIYSQELEMREAFSAYEKYMVRVFLILSYLGLDVLTIFLSFLIVGYLKFHASFFSNFFFKGPVPPFVLIVFIVLITNATLKLYNLKTYVFWDEMKNIIIASIISTIIIIVFSFASKTDYSRIMVVIGMIAFCLAELIIRYLYRIHIVRSRLLETRTLIIGLSEVGEILSQKMAKDNFISYNIIGFVKIDEQTKNSFNKYRVLGNLSNIDEIISKYSIDEVMIDMSSMKREELSKVISSVEGKVKRIKFIPDMYQLITFATEIQDIDGVIAISTSYGLLKPINRFIKRIFDIVLGSVGLIVFFILYLIIGIKIKMEDKGPILFLHDRIGKDLKTFKMFKFRTMVNDADKKLEELLKDEKVREEFYKNFKLKDDPRITKIGKFLRKTSLDEFPQFINVIKGDMSIVGPRPVVKKEVDLYYGEDIAKKVFKVKPGITGIWQTSGRSDVEDYEERISLDIYYVRNWSLWLDIVIILKTIKSVLKRTGAY